MTPTFNFHIYDVCWKSIFFLKTANKIREKKLRGKKAKEVEKEVKAKVSYTKHKALFPAANNLWISLKLHLMFTLVKKGSYLLLSPADKGQIEIGKTKSYKYT